MDLSQVTTTSVNTLNVAQLGNGPPLVLLHGLIRRWQDFGSVLPNLAGRFRISAADFRGHGESGRKPGSYYVVDYVDDAKCLVEQSAEPVVVYGHSLGSMVAAAVAAEHPERVRAIILEDPPFETMGTRIAESGLLSYLQQIQQLAQANLELPQLVAAMAEIQVSTPGSKVMKRLGDVRDADTLNFAARCLASADPEVLSPVVRGEWLRGYDLSGLLSRIQCPVLLMQGNVSLGALLIDDDVRLAQDKLRKCTVARFDDVGHHIHWQQPEKTVATIHSFMASID
jgi:pimeloyl-ACP methyl ester carboxylesterase